MLRFWGQRTAEYLLSIRLEVRRRRCKDLAMHEDCCQLETPRRHLWQLDCHLPLDVQTVKVYFTIRVCRVERFQWSGVSFYFYRGW